jgi:mannose-6-phosphate isomerase-like protein (cupin superfamily)
MSLGTDLPTSAGLAEPAVTQPDGFGSLADLLASGEDLAALRAAWGRNPVLLRASEGAAGLVSIATLEEWINASGILPPKIRMLADGKPLPAAEFVKQRNFPGLSAASYADCANIRRWLDKGATLEFHPVEEWHQPTARLCGGLAAALCAQVNAVVFLTPRREYGRGVHSDAAHVLAVQLAGSKTWEIYDRVDDAGSVAPRQTVTLTPGDLYYLPAGTPHRACAGGTGSLHVTFTVVEPTLRALIDVWSRRYVASFGRHQWIGGSRTKRTETVRQWLAAISEALTATDAASLLEKVEREWATPRAGWVGLPEIAEAGDSGEHSGD